MGLLKPCVVGKYGEFGKETGERWFDIEYELCRHKIKSYETAPFPITARNRSKIKGG